jgi:hypothetical protein
MKQQKFARTKEGWLIKIEHNEVEIDQVAAP